jgi:hypothetical protein
MVSQITDIVGANPTFAPTTLAGFAVGSRIRQSDGSEWIYAAIPTSTAIRQYDCCVIIASNGTVNAITSTLALRGMAICIAQQAVSSDTANIQYMWFLLSNPLASTTYKVRVALSCAIDAKLATTAMGGTLDDTTGGTVLRVDGIVLTDSQPAGSSGSRTFRTSNYPLTWGAV